MATLKKSTAVLERPESPAVPRGTLDEIALDLVDVGDNVRVNIAELEELTASIRAHGVLQPVKVVPAGDRYRLVWGQRRVLASRLAGRTTISAIVEYSESDGTGRSIEQLVENLHRADLNPIDRAAAMRAVVDSGISQADLARQLGIAPSTVANDLGLLEAPERVRRALEQGEITPAHAKAMKGLAPKTQGELLGEIAKSGLSAHETESQVREIKRRADWQREQQERSEASFKAKEAAYAASIATVAQGKVPKDGRLIVYLTEYSYGADGIAGKARKAQRIAELLREAGFTNVSTAGQVSPRPKGGCDCVVWKVDERNVYVGSDYVTKVSVTPGCVKDAHLKAVTKLDEAARQRLYKLEQAVLADLPKHTLGQAMPAGPVAGIELNRLAAQMALWNALDWGLGDWAKARGGPKAKPWEVLRGLSDDELATELVKAVAKNFRDHAGYRVDWVGLGEEIGLPAGQATA